MEFGIPLHKHEPTLECKKDKRPFPHGSTVTSEVTKGDAPYLQLEFLSNSVSANEKSALKLRFPANPDPQTNRWPAACFSVAAC